MKKRFLKWLEAVRVRSLCRRILAEYGVSCYKNESGIYFSSEKFWIYVEPYAESLAWLYGTILRKPEYAREAEVFLFRFAGIAAPGVKLCRLSETVDARGE